MPFFSYSNGNYKLSNVFERSGIAASYILKVMGSLKQRERQESKGSLSFYIFSWFQQDRHWILNKGHPHYSRSVPSGNLCKTRSGLDSDIDWFFRECSRRELDLHRRSVDNKANYASSCILTNIRQERTSHQQ